MERIFCRKCKTATNHSVLNKVTTGENDEEAEIWVSWDYKTLQCMGCETVCLLEEYTCSEDYDFETGQLDVSKKVYPQSSYSDREELHETYYLPDIIKTAYRETVTAYNHNLSLLAGIGLRTIIEAICKEKGVIKGKLIEKIDKLVEMGLMTSQEAELLHLNRYIGNMATHDIAQTPKDELKTGLDIIDATLQNAYILPKKAKMLKLKSGINI